MAPGADRPPPPRPRADHRALPARHRRRAGALRLRPPTTIDALKAGLAERGLALTDVRHLLLSHIHLDHAGAAGMLVREHPALQVHVSAIGAPHLVDPCRLERARAGSTATRSTRSGASSRRCRRRTSTSSATACSASTASRRRATRRTTSATSTATARSTPATRPACGSSPSALVHAADAAARVRRRGAGSATIDEIERRAPERLALIHFGVAEDVGAPPRRAAARAARLGRVVERRRDRGGVRRVRARRARATRARTRTTYDHAMPLWQSYRGLKRWAEKQAALVSAPSASRSGRGGRSATATSGFSSRPARSRTSGRTSRRSPSRSRSSTSAAAQPRSGSASPRGRSRRSRRSPSAASSATGCRGALVMIASDVASFVVRTAMGVLLVSGHAEVWELIALQACGGAAVAFYSPASYGLVREVVPADAAPAGERLPRDRPLRSVPARRRGRRDDRRVVGSGTALLFDAGDVRDERLAPLAAATSCRSPGPARSFLRELREGWSAFVEHTWVWVLVLWISLYFLITYAPFFVLGPYIAKHSHGRRGLVDVRRRAARESARCSAASRDCAGARAAPW